MAKTRKRQIKQRGGASCLFVLGSIIDSIKTLINIVDKIKKKTDIEKINKINFDLYYSIESAFNKQIDTTCTDIKKSDYTSLITSLKALYKKFEEKQDIFSNDTQKYLTRIETMKIRASELSDLIIEPLPNPPQIKSKTVKRKTLSKVVRTTNVMPPLPPTLTPALTPALTPTHVAAATVEEKAVKEAKKNADKKARREIRKADEEARKADEEARKADEEARKADEEARKADEEATRKKIAKMIANEAASKIAAKKNAEKKIIIQSTVQMLEEKAAASKAAEEARVNDITKRNIELFFDDFTKYNIDPLGIITQEQANKYITTLFPNVKFTDKITGSTLTQTKITNPDSDAYIYYSYVYIMYIGLLNNYLRFLTEQYNLFAGLKLVFKGGRAAQIMLPKESNLLSDDTDIFIQSTNIEHTPFFLKMFAIQLAKSWTKSQQIISRIGKENPNIVKIAYRGSTRYIPISDIDFGSPTYPQYYNDIIMVHKKWMVHGKWKIISEPLMPETKLATNHISLDFVYYHQSFKSFFAEKQFIYDMYLNPIYKTCNCGVVPHTEDCIASCSERQFYLDKFKKYVDVISKPPSCKRKTQKKQSDLSL